MSDEQRGYISGRRIVGNIGGLSSVVDPISQAMGEMTYPALNLTGIDQSPWDVNGSATQNYALGSRIVIDERVFRYARAGANLVAPCTYRLQVNGDVNSPTTWGLAIGADVALAGTTITVTVGAYQGGVVAANELTGGWIEVWGAANLFMWRRIISNTATAVGGNIVITVDKPWNSASLIADTTVALHHSSYYNVVMGGSVPAIVGYESAVGLTPVPVAAGRYFWLQTYGPCFIASQLGNPGAVIGFRDVYYGTAGTVIDLTGALAGGANVGPQRIGYISGASTNADGNNDVVLQLAP